MARKPKTKLPDVFARPGQAPERNTAIEDLPKTATPALEATDAAAPVSGSAGDTIAIAAVPAEAAVAPPAPPIAAAPPAPGASGPDQPAPPAGPPDLTAPPATVPAQAAAVEAVPEPAATVTDAPEPPSPVAVAPEPVASVAAATVTGGPEPPPPVAVAPVAVAPEAVPPEPAAPEPAAPAAAVPNSPTAGSAAPELPAAAPATPAPVAAVAEPAAPAAAVPEPVTAAGANLASPATPAPAPHEAAAVATGGASPEPVAPQQEAAGTPPPPPRPVRPPQRRPSQTVSAEAEARKATWLAGTALLLALFAPVLEDTVLGVFGFATPAARAQRELSLTLARQNQKLRDLDQRLATATEQLATNRVEMRQSALHGSDGAAWGRLLSLGRLADALRGATPFASDLAVAQAVGGNVIDDFAEDLGKLAAYAGTGVPTLRDIDTEFHRIADDTLRPKGGILPAVLVRNLSGWDQWTRTPPPPDPGPALVQAATTRLAEGDIEDAIARITQLGAPNDAAFAGWLEDARARVTADALVRRIDRTVGRLAHDLPK